MKILITGSSGLVGSNLVPFLQTKGHEVYKLVCARANLLPHEIAWDLQQGVISPALLEGMDAVVHLAGESILGRWTSAKKAKIKESRVKGTQLLCQALCQLKHPPAVLISASAIGYYDNRGDEMLQEESAKGYGFLADVCQEWEEATRMAADHGIRTLNLRLGMVLSPKGGALKQMLPIFNWGLGGQIGDGNQFVSWIALDDLMRVIEEGIQQEKLKGPVNAVTPYPVTNRKFTQTLGHVLHRPTFIPFPTFAVQLFFGEMGKELLLGSQRVQPKKLEEVGFQFKYPRLEQALQYLLTHLTHKERYFD